MFQSRITKSRVNKIHERAWRLVYDDSLYLSFDELLIKDKSVSVHQRNLQLLATEIFKVKNRVYTGLTEDIFHFANKPYDLQNNRIPFRKRNRTVFYGTESLSSLALRIWELMPQSLKDEAELSQLKTKIKTWTTSQCPWRLCIYWSCWFHLSCSSASILPSFLIPVFCIFLRDCFKTLMQILINFLYSICLYDCNVDLFFSVWL